MIFWNVNARLDMLPSLRVLIIKELIGLRTPLNANINTNPLTIHLHLKSFQINLNRSRSYNVWSLGGDYL